MNKDQKEQVIQGCKEMKFPIVRNVSSKLLADEIIPFNFYNPEDRKKWEEILKELMNEIEWRCGGMVDTLGLSPSAEIRV